MTLNDKLKINSEKEFLDLISPCIHEDKKGKPNFYELENKIINFELKLPFLKVEWEVSKSQTLKGESIDNLLFINCEFNEKVKIKGFKPKNEKSVNYIFEDNCIFHDMLIINDNSIELEFIDSIFANEINCMNSVLSNKIRFINCEFNQINFQNTKFEDLADFWMCTFNKSVIFYKTDFLWTAVFSSAKFKENVLFTYTLIEKVIIFRGTNFEKGLDLSTSILTGKLSYFDVKLKNYISTNAKSGTTEYENDITESADIPTINKIETFRIIKDNYQKQNNNIDSIEMKQLEITSLLEQINLNLKSKEDRFKNWLEKILLYLNKYSNNYGSDYRYGLIFTFIATILFGTLTLLSTDSFYNNICFKDCSFNSNTFVNGVEYYFHFLNPVHSISYLKDLNPIFGIAYVFDFFGRVIIGYGIYQTIQAFRKYK